MRTLILKAPGKWEWQEAPEPANDGVLVAVRRVGICGTDIHAYAGRHPAFVYPRRMGHEISAQVIEEGGSLAPGTLCAVNPYLNCNNCSACLVGRTNCCVSLSVMGIHCDGGFAPRLRVPIGHLHPSSLLSTNELALVEPLVVGYHATRRVPLTPDEPVLVAGLGPIGLAVAQCALLSGVSLAVVDTRSDRRAAARRLTSHVFEAGSGLEQNLRDAFGGQLPRVVFDATGSRAAVHFSYNLLAPGGILVFVGLYKGDFVFDDPDFHRRELSLLASRNGTQDDFVAVLHHLESGALDPHWMITEQVAFGDVPARMASLDGASGCIKALVRMSES